VTIAKLVQVVKLGPEAAVDPPADTAPRHLVKYTESPKSFLHSCCDHGFSPNIDIFSQESANMSVTQTCTVTATPDPVHLSELSIDVPLTMRSRDSEGGVSKSRTWAIIVCVASATALGSFMNGVIAVSLPALAADLALDPALMLW
jgi:hypothetical protein